jgi:hypothetical protein
VLELTYVICNVEKISGRFINPRSPLKRETEMGKEERKGGNGKEREGMIGEGDSMYRKGKERERKRRKEWEGKGREEKEKGSVLPLKVFRHLYA